MIHTQAGSHVQLAERLHCWPLSSVLMLSTTGRRAGSVSKTAQKSRITCAGLGSTFNLASTSFINMMALSAVSTPVIVVTLFLSVSLMKPFEKRSTARNFGSVIAFTSRLKWERKTSSTVLSPSVSEEPVGGWLLSFFCLLFTVGQQNNYTLLVVSGPCLLFPGPGFCSTSPAMTRRSITTAAVFKVSNISFLPAHTILADRIKKSEIVAHNNDQPHPNCKWTYRASDWLAIRLQK